MQVQVRLAIGIAFIIVIIIAIFAIKLIDDSHALEGYAREGVLESEIHLLCDGLLADIHCIVAVEQVDLIVDVLVHLERELGVALRVVGCESSDACGSRSFNVRSVGEE
jgi:hypothetical protein